MPNIKETIVTCGSDIHTDIGILGGAGEIDPDSDGVAYAIGNTNFYVNVLWRVSHRFTPLYDEIANNPTRQCCPDFHTHARGTFVCNDMYVELMSQRNDGSWRTWVTMQETGVELGWHRHHGGPRWIELGEVAKTLYDKAMDYVQTSSPREGARLASPAIFGF